MLLSEARTLSRKATIEIFFSLVGTFWCSMSQFPRSSDAGSDLQASSVLVRRSARLSGLPPEVVPIDMSSDDDFCMPCVPDGRRFGSRCCGVHVHPSCRDLEQLCLFCVDMDCSEVAPDDGSCVLCTLDQDENNSLILLCCRNRIHVGCFAQSVQHCGT